jgi:hypothetical protein
MKNKIKLFIFSLGLMTGAMTLAVADIKTEPKSTYLDASKGCVEIASEPDEEGYSKNECPSFSGIRIFNESGDAREWLSFQREKDSERTAITRFGLAHLTDGKVELRYIIKDERIIPIGVIYRISGADNTDKLNPNKAVQTIVVISFIGKEINEVTTIDGSMLNANSKARIALDASIATK